MARPESVIEEEPVSASAHATLRPARNGRAAPSAPHESRLYGELSHLYDRLVGRFFLPRITQVVHGLAIPAGARVLEVGVGTGASLPAYPGDCEVTGLDRSAEMLEVARRRVDRMGLRHVHLVEGDATRLPFADDAFDYVMAFHVVTVVDRPDRIMGEILRVCRPGGTVVVVNRFRSDTPWLDRLERRMEPVTRHWGWHTMRRRDLLAGQPVRVLRRFRGGPCGVFTTIVIRCVKRPASAPSGPARAPHA